MKDDIRPSFESRKPEEATPPPDIVEETIDLAVQPSPASEIGEEQPPESNLITNDEGGIGVVDDVTEQKKRLHHKITELGMKLWPESKKQRIIGAIIIVLLLAVGAGGVYALNKHFNKKAPQVAPQAVKKEEPPKTTEASKLTGAEVPLGTNKRPIVSIQIENSPDARPQSGLKDAGVVFEAVAEGGITRFNASFLDTLPDYIGPIRSVRPYYVDFVAPFDPVFVHAGGSADGLAQLRNIGLKDLDHGANASAFQRVSERYAPHNLYSSMAKLDTASNSRGYTSSNTVGFARNAKANPGQPITAKSVDFNLSGFLYNAHFDYDPASNSYLRSQAGKPHTDLRSGAQLTPKVVVAIVTDYSQRGIYSVYRMNGSGKVVIFQDGIATEGTWTKGGAKEQYKFTDASGKELKLNPGQTWVTMLAGADRISYKAQ